MAVTGEVGLDSQSSQFYADLSGNVHVPAIYYVDYNTSDLGLIYNHSLASLSTTA